MLDGHVAARLIRQSSRQRDYVEKAPLSNRGVRPGAGHLSQHRDGLRCGFGYENGNVRASDEASILQPLLDQTLSFLRRQVCDVNIINQWKIKISRIVDASFG